MDRPPTDYGPWGGIINVNSDVAWHFGLNTDGLEPDETDFLTVMMGQLMHVLGFGPADSFNEHLDHRTMNFTGPESLAVGSSNNPELEMNDGGHWRTGTTSTFAGQPQEALMGPVFPPGQRRYATALDRAALRDLGWHEAQPGDANLDRRFDASDIVTVLQGGKYQSDELASWRDGDWNDDLRFDQADIVSALATGRYLAGPYAAIRPGGVQDDEQTSIVYDAGTGEIAVDTPASSELTGIQITSESGIFTERSDCLRFPGAGFGDSFACARFDSPDDHTIYKATFGSSFRSLSFGTVAQAGLSEDFVANDLTVDGRLVGGNFLGNVDLIYIPEPSTVTLALMAAVGLGMVVYRNAERRRVNR